MQRESAEQRKLRLQQEKQQQREEASREKRDKAAKKIIAETKIAGKLYQYHLEIEMVKALDKRIYSSLNIHLKSKTNAMKKYKKGSAERKSAQTEVDEIKRQISQFNQHIKYRNKAQNKIKKDISENSNIQVYDAEKQYYSNLNLLQRAQEVEWDDDVFLQGEEKKEEIQPVPSIELLSRIGQQAIADFENIGVDIFSQIIEPNVEEVSQPIIIMHDYSHIHEQRMLMENLQYIKKLNSQLDNLNSSTGISINGHPTSEYRQFLINLASSKEQFHIRRSETSVSKRFWNAVDKVLKIFGTKSTKGITTAKFYDRAYGLFQQHQRIINRDRKVQGLSHVEYDVEKIQSLNQMTEKNAKKIMVATKKVALDYQRHIEIQIAKQLDKLVLADLKQKLQEAKASLKTEKGDDFDIAVGAVDEINAKIKSVKQYIKERNKVLAKANEDIDFNMSIASCAQTFYSEMREQNTPDPLLNYLENKLGRIQAINKQLHQVSDTGFELNEDKLVLQEEYVDALKDLVKVTNPEVAGFNKEKEMEEEKKPKEYGWSKELSLDDEFQPSTEKKIPPGDAKSILKKDQEITKTMHGLFKRQEKALNYNLKKRGLTLEARDPFVTKQAK